MQNGFINCTAAKEFSQEKEMPVDLPWPTYATSHYILIE